MLCISVKLKNLKANHNVTLKDYNANEVVYIRKVKKSESKSQQEIRGAGGCRLCISVKLKNLKANHNGVDINACIEKLCISVKLKNLKANHNQFSGFPVPSALCISVKLKNLKANHNILPKINKFIDVVYIRKVKKSESKSQHQGTCSTKIFFERNRGRLSTQLIRLS